MQKDLIYIGKINTPYNTLDECPNNVSPDGPMCSLVVNEEYKNGLFGLSAGDKILILYWLYNGQRTTGLGTSRRTGETKGTFALRTPKRPNPIGAATLKIEKIEDNIVYVKGLDCLNGTMLLDIKPDMRPE